MILARIRRFFHCLSRLHRPVTQQKADYDRGRWQTVYLGCECGVSFAGEKVIP
jgi:hypothetical protein